MRDTANGGCQKDCHERRDDSVVEAALNTERLANAIRYALVNHHGLAERCIRRSEYGGNEAGLGDCQSSFEKKCGDAGCRFARIAEDIRSRHGETIAELAQLSKPPAVSTEGLDLLRQRLASVPNNDAKSIGVSNTTRPRASIG